MGLRPDSGKPGTITDVDIPAAASVCRRLCAGRFLPCQLSRNSEAFSGVFHQGTYSSGGGYAAKDCNELSLCNGLFDGDRNDARLCPNHGGGFGARILRRSERSRNYRSKLVAGQLRTCVRKLRPAIRPGDHVVLCGDGRDRGDYERPAGLYAVQLVRAAECKSEPTLRPFTRVKPRVPRSSDAQRVRSDHRSRSTSTVHCELRPG